MRNRLRKSVRPRFTPAVVARKQGPWVTGASGDDFSALYAAWFAVVLRWTKAMGVRSHDRFDVAQNVFVIVHRRLPYCDCRNLAGWLYTITARQVRDFQRQKWNKVVGEALPISPAMPSGAPTPMMVLEGRQGLEVLTEVLSSFSDPLRSTFVLFEIYGFTCAEIATKRDAPTNTVWSWLRRGRRKIIDQLIERQTGRRTQTSRPSRSEAHPKKQRRRPRQLGRDIEPLRIDRGLFGDAAEP